MFPIFDRFNSLQVGKRHKVSAFIGAPGSITASAKKKAYNHISFVVGLFRATLREARFIRKEDPVLAILRNVWVRPARRDTILLWDMTIILIGRFTWTGQAPP